MWWDGRSGFVSTSRTTSWTLEDESDLPGTTSTPTLSKIPKGKGKGKYQRRTSKSPRRQRRSPDLPRRVPSPRSRRHLSKTPQRSHTPPKHRRQSGELHMKSEKENGRHMAKRKVCPDYQQGRCVTHGLCPDHLFHKCFVCDRSGHGSAVCWFPIGTLRGRDVCASGTRLRAQKTESGPAFRPCGR